MSDPVKRKRGRKPKADADRLSQSVCFRCPESPPVSPRQVREAVRVFLEKSKSGVQSKHAGEEELALVLRSTHRKRKRIPFDTNRRMSWAGMETTTRQVKMTDDMKALLVEASSASSYPLGILLQAAVRGDFLVLSDPSEYCNERSYLLTGRAVRTKFDVIPVQLQGESEGAFVARMEATRDARRHLIALFDRSPTLREIEEACIIQKDPSRQKRAVWVGHPADTLSEFDYRTWLGSAVTHELVLSSFEKGYLDRLSWMTKRGMIGTVIRRALAGSYVALVDEGEVGTISPRDMLRHSLLERQAFGELMDYREATSRRPWWA